MATSPPTLVPTKATRPAPTTQGTTPLPPGKTSTLSPTQVTCVSEFQTVVEGIISLISEIHLS